jgi:hypothetical protein
MGFAIPVIVPVSFAVTIRAFDLYALSDAVAVSVPIPITIRTLDLYAFRDVVRAAA